MPLSVTADGGHHTLPYPVGVLNSMSCPVLPCPASAVLCCALPRLVLSCLALSCPALLCPALLYPAGPYLDDPKVAKQFTDAYMEMVAGFLTFPLKFPGTAVWRAMKVRG